MAEKLGPCDRNSSYADKAGDRAVEDGGLRLKPEKVGIVGIESGIEVGFYCGEVDAVVFDAGVVAHDCEGKNRKQ